MIEQGATTTWEYWEGHRSKIHNCYNGIGSWFIQGLGGIVPISDTPGYKHFIIRPQIPQGLEWVKVSKETPYGTVSSAWKAENDRIIFDIHVPTNSSATFVSPFEITECLLNEKSQNLERGMITLDSGNYQIVINHL